MSPGQPLLQLEGISKRFGPVQALDRVDFAVSAGEVVGLVGDNGAGKSTLVKAIAGINPPDSGTVRWEGDEVSINKPQDATNLAMIERLAVGDFEIQIRPPGDTKLVKIPPPSADSGINPAVIDLLRKRLGEAPAVKR